MSRLISTPFFSVFILSSFSDHYDSERKLLLLPLFPFELVTFSHGGRLLQMEPSNSDFSRRVWAGHWNVGTSAIIQSLESFGPEFLSFYSK